MLSIRSSFYLLLISSKAHMRTHKRCARETSKDLNYSRSVRILHITHFVLCSEMLILYSIAYLFRRHQGRVSVWVVWWAYYFHRHHHIRCCWGWSEGRGVQHCLGIQRYKLKRAYDLQPKFINRSIDPDRAVAIVICPRTRNFFLKSHSSITSLWEILVN